MVMASSRGWEGRGKRIEAAYHQLKVVGAVSIVLTIARVFIAVFGTVKKFRLVRILRGRTVFVDSQFKLHSVFALFPISIVPFVTHANCKRERSLSAFQRIKSNSSVPSPPQPRGRDLARFVTRVVDH